MDVFMEGQVANLYRLNPGRSCFGRLQQRARLPPKPGECKTRDCSRCLLRDCETEQTLISHRT